MITWWPHIHALVVALVIGSGPQPVSAQGGSPASDEADTIVAKLDTVTVHENASERVRLLVRLLELRREDSASDEVETAQLQIELVRARMWTREYGKAEREARAAFETMFRRLGEEHADTAEALRLLAKTLERAGRRRDAEPLLRRAIAMSRAAHGGDHWSIAHGLLDLGTLLADLGNYDAAEEACAESVAMRRRLFGNADAQLARGLEGYGILLHRRGNYDDAERRLREALAIRRRLDGNPLGIARCEQTLAATLMAAGDIAEAETLLVGALDVLRGRYGDDHWQVASGLSLLGTIRGERGDYASATRCLEQAIGINQRTLGGGDYLVTQSIVRLVDVLRAQGRLDDAETWCRKALAAERAARGDEHRGVASCLARLVQILDLRGEVAQARALAEETLAMRRHLLPADHPEVASSLNSLARLLVHQGRLDDAEPLLREAIGIYRKKKGDEHPAVGAGLHNLAWLNSLRGDREHLVEAERLYGEALTRLRRARHAGLHATCTQRALLLRQLGRPGEAEALLEEAIAHIEGLRRRSAGDEIDRARLFSHVTARDPFQQMIRLQMDAGAPDRAFTYLERGRARALLDLLARGAGDGAAQPWALADLAAALHEDEILLAYDVSGHDAVLLTLRSSGRVDGFELGPLVDPSEPSHELFLKLVPPDLRSEITAAARVIIVADGALAALPFDALPVRSEGDERWIDTGPPIIRAPSGSVLADRRLRARGREPEPMTLLAIGDPIVDVPLPASAAEVRAIAELVRRTGAPEEGITVLTRERATLEQVRKVMTPRRLLHFATHGVVEDGRRARDSALALSVDTESAGADDGLLRLGELLDDWAGRLEGTELVTLSACRTARGTSERGEGFVALTWGFLHAGAGNVVASLWKVDDTATGLLMRRFYANLLGTDAPPMPMAEALDEAKRWLRGLSAAEARLLAGTPPAGQTTRGLKYEPAPDVAPDAFPYRDPFYWAAFVLIGGG